MFIINFTQNSKKKSFLVVAIEVEKIK